MFIKQLMSYADYKKALEKYSKNILLYKIFAFLLMQDGRELYLDRDGDSVYLINPDKDSYPLLKQLADESTANFELTTIEKAIDFSCDKTILKSAIFMMEVVHSIETKTNHIGTLYKAIREAKLLKEEQVEIIEIIKRLGLLEEINQFVIEFLPKRVILPPSFPFIGHTLTYNGAGIYYSFTYSPTWLKSTQQSPIIGLHEVPQAIVYEDETTPLIKLFYLHDYINSINSKLTEFKPSEYLDPALCWAYKERLANHEAITWLSYLNEHKGSLNLKNPFLKETTVENILNTYEPEGCISLNELKAIFPILKEHSFDTSEIEGKELIYSMDLKDKNIILTTLDQYSVILFTNFTEYCPNELLKL